MPWGVTWQHEVDRARKESVARKQGGEVQRGRPGSLTDAASSEWKKTPTGRSEEGECEQRQAKLVISASAAEDCIPNFWAPAFL